MESAKVISVNHKKHYGFAQVVIFIDSKKNKIIKTSEEIFFHFGRGYKMKSGKNKPVFNHKQRLKKTISIGEYLVFVRKKRENGNLRDRAMVWGLRNQYKELWGTINKRSEQQKKLLKINQVFQKIEIEKNQETRKAL